MIAGSNACAAWGSGHAAGFATTFGGKQGDDNEPQSTFCGAVVVLNALRCRGYLAALSLAILSMPGGATAAEPGDEGARAAPLAVKVFVINLFSLEAAPWIEALKPTREIPVPGLSSDYPAAKCNAEAVCQVTTGMGHSNAAASVMAVLYSGLFDLRQTYFLVAGIAGIDPQRGTIGSAAWARYVVDAGIAHEIDARELPHGWHDGYFGVNTDAPDQTPKFDYRTELFRLDEALLREGAGVVAVSCTRGRQRVARLSGALPRGPANRPPSRDSMRYAYERYLVDGPAAGRACAQVD